VNRHDSTCRIYFNKKAPASVIRCVSKLVQVFPVEAVRIRPDCAEVSDLVCVVLEDCAILRDNIARYC